MPHGITSCVLLPTVMRHLAVLEEAGLIARSEPRLLSVHSNERFFPGDHVAVFVIDVRFKKSDGRYEKLEESAPVVIAHADAYAAKMDANSAPSQALAAYLNADFIWLPDLGIRDNGHMLMIENNSHEIVQVLFDWLHGQGF